MPLSSIIFIALGLAMDAFAVSIASGVTMKRCRFEHALKVALFFGLFQAIMPVVGWLAGLSLQVFIQHAAPWVAFTLLSLVGGKMIIESFKIGGEKNVCDPTDTVTLLVLAVATSIDALAVGVTFALLQSSIVEPVLIIGAVTLALSLAGVYIGDRIGHLFENKIEMLGGFILIGIGIKILIDSF